MRPLVSHVGHHRAVPSLSSPPETTYAKGLRTVSPHLRDVIKLRESNVPMPCDSWTLSDGEKRRRIYLWKTSRLTCTCQDRAEI